MISIDLQTVPAQRFAVGLDGQSCVISLDTHDGVLYLGLDVNDAPVIRGAICHDRQSIIRYQSAFRGNLFFVDHDGVDDPEYSGLGSRFDLCYLTEEEVAAL